MAERSFAPRHTDMYGLRSIPTREYAEKVTTKKSPVTFPSEKLPPTENGSGRILFNRGNPEDPSYDPFHVLSRLTRALIPFEGVAPLPKLIEEINAISDQETPPVSEDDVKNVIGIKGVIFAVENEDGTEIIQSPPLQEYIAELRENGVKHPLIPQPPKPVLLKR